ncbi:hypothetical protein SAMN06265380_101855 [Ruegeria faecimaris]|uniref:Uncharacterized protein n=1 Tax=Ruegeria faecimaris TaxID=686389 RepID=A0A521BHH3_9RHOB|nr:hypothetical protein SAMN06265380_101855 [Ruegeria faecimaris]
MKCVNFTGKHFENSENVINIYIIVLNIFF